MRINLTTPMSGDEERERHTKAVINAIEQYTEERMADEYGRIHTDGSRSGGQPTVATQKAHAMLLEVLAEWGIAVRNATAQQLAVATTEALCRAIDRQEDLRQPTQSDAAKLADELQEAGEHPCRAHLAFGKLLRDGAAALRQPTQSEEDDWEVLAVGYQTLSGKAYHMSDCATCCAPAYKPSPCDCDAPTQSDALRDQLLQECLVKLRDVQGTEAPKQYACNLIKRIERVLQGQSK